jgi:dihydrofolate synthase/folylpolyglutamate synthase
MKNVNKQTSKGVVALGKQRSYNEVIEFLDANWQTNTKDATLSCMKQLDSAFGNLSQKTNTILVGGTNGKSLTINFAVKLLREEGLNVGAFYAPHILTYNERMSINDEVIANKTFTDIANEVLNTAETLELTPNSYEILTMMALVYFDQHNVDVAVLEVTEHPATTLCNPKISVITRVTQDNAAPATPETERYITQLLGIVKKGTHVISADQSKLNLQIMLDKVKEKGGVWDMPIRKLVPLAYPFEQLHGRCAALAERIAHVYINTFAHKDAVVVTNSLLTKKKGLRGRPTLEAKRQSELNPKKTIDQFWKDVNHSLSSRFQLLDKEKPTILLDNAQNLDAFKNLLLGIRLLHYQRPLKGLTLVIGCNNNDIDLTEFLKLLRYFFKKTSGSIVLCPVTTLPGHKGAESWDIEKVTNSTKSMKIKAKACSTFKEAFETACKSVDERHGLVVVTGSPSIITEYWRYKGVKKL